MVFTIAFQIEEVDNKIRIIELQLEFVNLKQEEIENIAKFITRINVLVRELSNS